jgi:hypothetical protein
MSTCLRCIIKKLWRPIAAVHVALCALLLAGCVDSAAPILHDAKPIFGQRARLHLYALRDGAAHEPDIATYRWNGSRYVIPRWRSANLSPFTIHDFEGNDSIVQSFSTKGEKAIEYALARKLADGVYLVIAIDENDADEATRAALCSKAKFSPCRIETREQLLAFARATAAKPQQSGGLAVLVGGRSLAAGTSPSLR